MRREKRVTLCTGIRWKISIAIAAVGALIALALSLVVHSAARVSMLESAREVQLERVQFLSRNAEATKKPPLGAKLNDPDLPRELPDKVRSGRRGTYLQESSGDTPEVWAALASRGTARGGCARPRRRPGSAGRRGGRGARPKAVPGEAPDTASRRALAHKPPFADGW